MLSCICIEVLQPSQPSGVMSSMVSLPIPHFYWAGFKSSKLLTSIVHILLPEIESVLSGVALKI